MYHSFVKHQLKVLQKCDGIRYKGVHFARKVSELAFDRYRCKQAALSRFKKLFKRGRNRTLIFVGHSPIGQSSPMKGYIRLPLNLMLKTLQDDGQIDVYYKDEHGSTKYCSFCGQEVFDSKSPDRFIRCANCKDTNVTLPPPLKWRTARNAKCWFVRTQTKAEAVARVREFNRDTAGGRNILHLGLAETTHQNIPSVYRRGAKKRGQSSTNGGPPAKRPKV